MKEIGQVEKTPNFNIMTGETTLIEHVVTQKDIDEANTKKIEQDRQAINDRLKQIDSEVAQARVIADIIAGNPVNERVLNLLTERDTLVAQLKTL